jgi:hypothetical protein
MAELASAAYFFEGGYDNSKVPAGYSVDPELSGHDRTVFVKGDHAYVAFRGTNVQNRRDLGTDALLFLGMEGISSRFQKSLRTTRSAIDKYGKQNVTVVGHSLGGTQALYVNSKTGVDAHAFNPGAALPQARRGILDSITCGIFRRKCTTRANVYTTGVDPISYLSKYSNAQKHHVTPRYMDVHGIKNFLRK